VENLASIFAKKIRNRKVGTKGEEINRTFSHAIYLQLVTALPTRLHQRLPRKSPRRVDDQENKHISQNF